MSFNPGSSDCYWVSNEEVEQHQDGEMNYAAVCNQHSEEEIVKPVEDIDEKECRGENCAGVAINVVWIFHDEDRCCLARCVLHRGQAAALIWHVLLWISMVFVVAGFQLLRGTVHLHRLVWLG